MALLIADVPGATPAEIGDYLSDRIVTTRRHNGDWNNQAFYSENSSAKNGQNPKEYSVTQEEVNFFPMSEPGDLYMSYWIRFQPGMIENMLGLDTSQVGATTNGGTWRSFFAFKTGTNASAGSAPLDNGDYRVEAYVLTGCSYDQITAQIPPCTGSNPNPAPFWMVNGDNVAGGSYALVNNWSELNSAIPVPDDGSWNKFEVFWHRSSGSDGRFWMAINGAQLVNHIGPNMGQASMSINRIMPELLYTGGHYPIYQWIDDIQIWDGGFPPSTCTPGVEYWCDPPYASH
ncbi:MAG TPA: hypothetical protein VMH77_02575 [Steroidobacteraceae bacterium]|nr:hypothetical protein [Steroidobacteraceae bacterium]